MDRIIAFTKFDISPNYAVKLSTSNDEIEVMGKRIPIQIIDAWKVSVRPCELDHFADLFGEHSKINGGTIEYRELKSRERGALIIVEYTTAYVVYDKYNMNSSLKCENVSSMILVGI